MEKPRLRDLAGVGPAKFVDTDTGKEIPQPAEGFLIVAGSWPNRLIGAIQVRCSFCNGFAALEQKGWELHEADKERRPVTELAIEMVDQVNREAAERRRA